MKSLMFVPAKPKMLAKIPASEADACIVDLEDSIAEEDKQQALSDVCQFLAQPLEKDIFVRVDRNHLDRQLEQLAALPFRGYMLPKFENAEAFGKHADAFRDREIIALVETPMGLVNIRETAASPMVDMLAFGAEDFTSSVGMKNCRETLHFPKSSIVAHAKAFGKPVFDTPSFIIDDMDALAAEIQSAVDLGFDGKLAIHPKQVAAINELFKVSDLDYLASLVARYEAAGEAVVKIDGKIYEKMHIAHFRRILKEHATE